MNKAILALTLLCGFFLGVIAGPWLWPRDLLQAPTEETLPPQATSLPAPPPPPPPPPAAPPPPTEAELVLKGVFAAADTSRARALIAHGEESPQLYKVDEKLPDGSVLRAVDIKEVQIEKDGEMQTLPLERGKPGTASDESEAPAENTEVNAPAALLPPDESEPPDETGDEQRDATVSPDTDTAP